MKKVKGDDGHLKSNDDNECGGGVEYSECIGLNWVAPLASHLLNTIISIFIIISHLLNTIISIFIIISIVSHLLNTIISIFISISIISIISHHLIIIISITFTFWQPIREPVIYVLAEFVR